MSCVPCRNRLAHRLINNHRRTLNWIEAMEIADKGMERYEKNKPKIVQFSGVKSLTQLEKDELLKAGIDPDYNQACIPAGACACFPPPVTICNTSPECLNPINTCSCSCPAPSKPNSHYVSDICTPTNTNNCTCGITLRCTSGKTCTCKCAGVCYYACDVGYVWNPVTLLCDLIPAAAAMMVGDGLTQAVC